MLHRTLNVGRNRPKAVFRRMRYIDMRRNTLRYCALH